MADVIVIGGGLGGLAACVALAEAGLSVKLLESRPRLGGRASSFEDSATGELIDNCQHVAMGCCTNFRYFCRVTGLEPFFQRQESLTFVGPPDSDIQRSPNFCKFGASVWGAAPLHLAGALAGLSYLTWWDKFKIAIGLRALVSQPMPEDERTAFSAWLSKQSQTVRAIQWFWDVVLVSALSESLDRISVTAARKVFVDGFLAHREGWEVWLPTVPLDELYSGVLTRWLTSHGVEICLKSGVERIVSDRDRVHAIELRSGERLLADHVVLAVPHQRVLAMLPESARNDRELARVDQLETAPIASVHLWFDRPLTLLPHAVLVGRQSQWVFRRGESGAGGAGESGVARLFNYQVVISNAREVASRPQADVVSDVVSELKGIWPWAADAKLCHSRVIIEHAAVFSPLPGSEMFRPAQQTRIKNLQLAGDWTRTGWPATMEGAVRSGFLAAENILRQRGEPTRCVQLDLPVSWLSRVLFGIG